MQHCSVTDHDIMGNLPWPWFCQGSPRKFAPFLTFSNSSWIFNMHSQKRMGPQYANLLRSSNRKQTSNLVCLLFSKTEWGPNMLSVWKEADTQPGLACVLESRLEQAWDPSRVGHKLRNTGTENPAAALPPSPIWAGHKKFKNKNEHS